MIVALSLQEVVALLTALIEASVRAVVDESKPNASVPQDLSTV
jgi:hypothetical protein